MHETGYAIVEVTDDGPEYHCGWSGDRTHDADQDSSGAPSRLVHVHALPSGDGFVVSERRGAGTVDPGPAVYG